MRGTIVILLALSGLWGDFTSIYHQNEIIDATADLYFDKEYDLAIENLSVLMDSMKIDDTGLALNRAHSMYMKNGFGGDLGTNYSQRADSTYVQMAEGTFFNYSRLWDSDDQFSTVGYNQSGIVTFKSRLVNGKIAEEDALIQSAMSYFKSALRKDPTNEKARYNYEVLKKYKEFPDMVMSRVRELVQQRRYADALLYLGPFVEKDKRFEKHVEYGKRLADIVTIERENEDES